MSPTESPSQPLSGLLGLRIVEATQDAEALILVFGNKGLMRVDLTHIFSPPADQLTGFVGTMVRGVRREDGFICIILDDDRVLEIDLRA